MEKPPPLDDEFDEKSLLMGLLRWSCHLKVSVDHIIDELYERKQERNKIIEQLHDEGERLYHESLLIAAQHYKDSKGDQAARDDGGEPVH